MRTCAQLAREPSKRKRVHKSLTENGVWCPRLRTEANTTPHSIRTRAARCERNSLVQGNTHTKKQMPNQGVNVCPFCELRNWDRFFWLACSHVRMGYTHMAPAAARTRKYRFFSWYALVRTTHTRTPTSRRVWVTFKHNETSPPQCAHVYARAHAIGGTPSRPRALDIHTNTSKCVMIHVETLASSLINHSSLSNSLQRAWMGAFVYLLPISPSCWT